MKMKKSKKMEMFKMDKNVPKQPLVAAGTKLNLWRSPFDPKPMEPLSAKERNRRKNKKKMAKESRKNNRKK